MRVLVTGGSGFIGTTLVRYLDQVGAHVINYDLRPPQIGTQPGEYIRGDILDKGRLRSAVRTTDPNLIVHLAARCDLTGSSIEEYQANTAGVRNMIEALPGNAGIERIIFSSSRYVHSNEVQPKCDQEYSPFTQYGASKVVGEQLVREGKIPIPWLIVRPTSIWGPWFQAPYRGFFDAVKRGLYLHPRGETIRKSFGYVGNSVHQIWRLLTAPSDAVNHRVFYLADYAPIDVREMAELIRAQCGAPPIREIPASFLKPLAIAGDLLKECGLRNPPLSSFRLRNLRAQMVYDLSETEKIAGPLPHTTEDGIRETVQWLKTFSSWR